MILFGVRSPIAVEYEETCKRLGVRLEFGVNLTGVPRCQMPREKIVPIAEFDAEIHHHQQFYSCAFGPRRREELIQTAEELGLKCAPALVDPHAVVPEKIRIGHGTFINAGVVIGAVTVIGSGVLVNRNASIGHHCLINDYVSVGPGATLASNIVVGEGAMIGVGAVILPDVRIGVDAVIAGGSLVREDVPDGGFVAGNPAKQRDFDPGKSSLNVSGAE